MRLLRLRLQLRDQTRTCRGHALTCSEQRFVKGGDLTPTRSRSIEQQIARAQRPLVVPQRPAICPVALRRKEVQKPPARLAGTAYKIDIAVGKIDQPRDVQ